MLRVALTKGNQTGVTEHAHLQKQKKRKFGELWCDAVVKCDGRIEGGTRPTQNDS